MKENNDVEEAGVESDEFFSPDQIALIGALHKEREKGAEVRKRRQTGELLTEEGWKEHWNKLHKVLEKYRHDPGYILLAPEGSIPGLLLSEEFRNLEMSTSSRVIELPMADTYMYAVWNDKLEQLLCPGGYQDTYFEHRTTVHQFQEELTELGYITRWPNRGMMLVIGITLDALDVIYGRLVVRERLEGDEK